MIIGFASPLSSSRRPAMQAIDDATFRISDRENDSVFSPGRVESYTDLLFANQAVDQLGTVTSLSLQECLPARGKGRDARAKIDRLRRRFWSCFGPRYALWSRRRLIRGLKEFNSQKPSDPSSNLR